MCACIVLAFIRPIRSAVERQRVRRRLLLRFDAVVRSPTPPGGSFARASPRRLRNGSKGPYIWTPGRRVRAVSVVPRNRLDNFAARIEKSRMDYSTSSTLRTCSTVAAVGVASGLLVGIFFERWRRKYTAPHCPSSLALGYQTVTQCQYDVQSHASCEVPLLALPI